MITSVDPIIFKPGYVFNEADFTTSQEILESKASGTIIDGEGSGGEQNTSAVLQIAEDTQQISYDSATTSTNIVKLTAGNFNTSLLESINENVQTNIDNLKQKTQGITHNNTVTTISNLNATILTAGNINTSHLSGTTSNLQSQVTALAQATTGVTYTSTTDTTTISNNVNITGTLTAPGLNLSGTFSQTTLYNTSLDNFQVTIPSWARSVDIVCQGAGGSGGASPNIAMISGRYHLSGGGGSAGGFSKTTMYRFPGGPTTLGLFNAVGGAGVDTFRDGREPIRDTYVTHGVNNYIVCWAQRGKGGNRGKENVLEGVESVASVTGGWGNITIGGAGAEGSRWNNNGGRRGFNPTATNGGAIILEGSAGGSCGGGLSRDGSNYTTGAGNGGGPIMMIQTAQNGPPAPNPTDFSTRAISSSVDFGMYGVGFCGPASSNARTGNSVSSTASTTGDGFGGSGGSSCGSTDSAFAKTSGKGGDGYIILTFNA